MNPALDIVRPPHTVWAVGADGVVAFGGGDAKPLLLPSKELIQETLSYAKELERIV